MGLGFYGGIAGADMIGSQSVVNILMDWVWALGVHGIKKPQLLLGVDACIVGKKPVAAINCVCRTWVITCVRQKLFSFLCDIPSFVTVGLHNGGFRKAGS